MTYRPIPNTVPDRVIKFLETQPKGAAISTAALAEAIDHDAGSMAGCLAIAKKNGLLVCSKKAETGNVTYWALGDGTPEPLPHDYEPDAPLASRRIIESLKATGQAPRPASSPFTMVEARTATEPARAPATAAPASTQPTATPRPLRLGFFNDGTMLIQRDQVELNLTLEETQQLLSFARSLPADPA